MFPKRHPNLFFKYFYFLFGPGLLYPLRVHIYFGSLAEPLTLLHPKMEMLRYREPRELETLVFFSILPGSMSLKYECNPALIGQMRVIPNSKNKYLKNKLGPLLSNSPVIGILDKLVTLDIHCMQKLRIREILYILSFSPTPSDRSLKQKIISPSYKIKQI